MGWPKNAPSTRIYIAASDPPEGSHASLEKHVLAAAGTATNFPASVMLKQKDSAPF